MPCFMGLRVVQLRNNITTWSSKNYDAQIDGSNTLNDRKNKTKILGELEEVTLDEKQ